MCHFPTQVRSYSTRVPLSELTRPASANTPAPSTASAPTPGSAATMGVVTPASSPFPFPTSVYPRRRVAPLLTRSLASIRKGVGLVVIQLLAVTRGRSAATTTVPVLSVLA